MRILVVDGSAEFLKAARFLMKELGHEPVGLARDGDEGLALAAGLDPDVVLVEVSQPGMDGLETTRRLKGRAGAPPVIAITRTHEAAFHRLCAEAGCDALIPKADLAADLPRVLTRLSASLARRAVRRPGGLPALECADV
jgi:CheY-like chemotaxis protein